jgi:hypothetical protein
VAGGVGWERCVSILLGCYRWRNIYFLRHLASFQRNIRRVCLFVEHLKFLTQFSSSFRDTMASLKHCSRCGFAHDTPVGKSKCNRPLQALPESSAAPAVEAFLLPEAVEDQAAGGANLYGDHIGSLVSLISQLVTRLDSQQEQLNVLQTAVASAAPVVSHSASAEAGQGAIPKGSCTQEALLADTCCHTSRSEGRQGVYVTDCQDGGFPRFGIAR